MNSLKLENDIKIKNLYIKLFNNFNNDDTFAMFDSINNFLQLNYKQVEINNIYRNYGIIVDKNNPNFSYANSKNNLVRSLQQSNYYNNTCYNPFLSIQDNNIFNESINTLPMYSQPIYSQPIYSQEYVDEVNEEVDEAVDEEVNEEVDEEVDEEVEETVDEEVEETVDEAVDEAVDEEVDEEVYEAVSNKYSQPMNRQPMYRQPMYRQPDFTNLNPFNVINNQQQYGIDPYGIQNPNINLIRKNFDNKIEQIQMQLNTLKSTSEFECEERINKVKEELTNQINIVRIKSDESISRYLNMLFDLLLKNQVISQNEIDNIKYKLSNNQVDLNTVIGYLENKKKFAKNQNILEKSYMQSNIIMPKSNTTMLKSNITMPESYTNVKQNDYNYSNFSPFK